MSGGLILKGKNLTTRVHTVRTRADSALSPLRGRREISATWTASRALRARAKPSCPEIRQCLNARNRQPRDFVCPHVLAQILLHTPLLRLEPSRRGCRNNTTTANTNAQPISATRVRARRWRPLISQGAHPLTRQRRPRVSRTISREFVLRRVVQFARTWPSVVQVSRGPSASSAIRACMTPPRRQSSLAVRLPSPAPRVRSAEVL